MNKPIRYGAIFSLVLVVILLANLTVIQNFREKQYAENPHNARMIYELKQTPRGQIIAGNTVLARSDADGDGFYQRSYPADSMQFSQIVGYISDQYGTSGIEASYNNDLAGRSAAVNANRLFKGLSGDTPHGANVELTMDPALQEKAYSLLNSSGYDGSIVALRPSSGEVLAMAANPSYDNAPLVNPATAADTWKALNNTPGNPLINGSTQQTLPPGSIFKIITTAAGLNSGFDPSSQLTGQSAITLPATETQLTNYDGTSCNGSSQVDLATAFAYSCNTAFVQMGLQVGQDKLKQYAKAFGVGDTYDLGIPMAGGSLGDLPDRAALGQTSIGQRDVTMSALQAAVMAATVANKGKRMEPHLVKRVTTADFSEISKVNPKEITQAVSPEQADTITQLMYGSERHTTGYNGNSYASKTGTAENGGPNPHVWYVAFDPAKDVAVAVMVKDGGGQGSTATGGKVSAPIGRAILDAAPKGGAS